MSNIYTVFSKLRTQYYGLFVREATPTSILTKDNTVNRLHISQVYNDYLFPAEERGDRYERAQQPHRDDHQEHSIPIQIFLSLLRVCVRERDRERE